MRPGSVRLRLVIGALLWGVSGVALADLPDRDRPLPPSRQRPHAPSPQPCAPGQGLSRIQSETSVDPAAPGKVVLNCEIAEAGALRDCRVVSEEPPGLGYADAALKVACAMRMSGAVVDTSGPRPRITFPVTFQLKN
jgi:protein TonB